MKQIFVIEFDMETDKVCRHELEDFVSERVNGVFVITESKADEFERYAKPVLDTWSLGNMEPETAMIRLMNKFQELYG